MKKILFTIIMLCCLVALAVPGNAQTNFSIACNIGSQRLNESTSMILSISDPNPSAHSVVGVQWAHDGVITNANTLSVILPGVYTATVFYYLPLDDRTKMFARAFPCPAITIFQSLNAPTVQQGPLSYNPVTPPVFQISNGCFTGALYRVLINGSAAYSQTVSCQAGSSSLPITGPGMYNVGVVVPGTSVTSYGIDVLVVKGDIPVPAITGSATLTYDSPTTLSALQTYNNGYTWFLNGQAIPNSNSKTYTVTKPGDYSVQGCAIYPDGTTQCMTSPITHVAGEVMTVNVVHRQIVLSDNISDAVLPFLTWLDVAASSTYLDGMARPIQEVQSNAAGNSLNDIVAVHQYDSASREVKQILPFVRNTSFFQFVNTALTPVKNFYQQDNDKIANTAFPYGETQFEPSPLNRPLKQGAPGEEWQLSGSHVKSTTYLNNRQMDNIWIWTSSASGVSASGFYADGMLSVVEIKDEDGKIVREYKDKLNRSIMIERVVEGNVKQRTYSVFDDFGRVAVIIPPNGSATLTGASPTITGSVLARECFVYTYDERGRVATKNIPGGGKQYFIYDKWDRVVLTQHANQRTHSRWTFHKYDAFDRLIITGEITLAGDNVAATQTVNSFYTSVSTNPSIRYEQLTTSNSGFHGYTNRSFPVLTDQYQAYSIFYFDNYKFLSSSDSAYHFVPESDLGLTTYNMRLQKSLTGVKNIFLGTHQYLKSVTYFDDKERLIQVISDNHLGGIDRTSNVLDFTGNVLKNRSVHHGKQNVTVDGEFKYDVRKRKLQEYSTVNGGPKILLYDYHYNALAQLVEKNIHSTDGKQFLQSLDYSYNIRGWLQQMNPVEAQAESNVTFQDQYGFELSYTSSSDALSGFQPNFNGNIAAFTERRPATTDATGSFKSAYTYQYDARNQLTQGKYLQLSDPSKNGVFDMPFITYDLNGNIKTLQRKGILTSGAAGVIDDLQYSYSGNQLTQVNDGGDLSKGFIKK